MKRALIILNGIVPGKRLLRTLTQQADYVIAADGGAHGLIDAEIAFHALVGDMDSVNPSRAAKLKDTLIIHEKGQDDTDFEKALRWTLANTESRDIIFSGGFGDEFDHVLTHLSVACKYSSKTKIRQIEDSMIIHFVTHHLEMEMPIGSQVSLIALGTADGVRTRGLHWPLNGETLSLGGRNGLHNIVNENPVLIEVRDGCLAVIQKKTKGSAFRW